MKRIKFTFYNSFTKENLGAIELAYDRIKAINNFYSRFWKMWRPFLANEYKIDKHFVRAKISIY